MSVQRLDPFRAGALEHLAQPGGGHRGDRDAGAGHGAGHAATPVVPGASAIISRLWRSVWIGRMPPGPTTRRSMRLISPTKSEPGQGAEDHRDVQLLGGPAVNCCENERSGPTQPGVGAGGQLADDGADHARRRRDLEGGEDVGQGCGYLQLPQTAGGRWRRTTASARWRSPPGERSPRSVLIVTGIEGEVGGDASPPPATVGPRCGRPRPPPSGRWRGCGTVWEATT